MQLRAGLLVCIMIASGACQDGPTGKLSPELAARLTAEGVLRRADDLTFRYTIGAGRSNAGWENRRASIVVTRSSVLVHKNEKTGIDIRPGQGDRYSVQRVGTRIRIRAGNGRGTEIWSFEPPADPAGWAADIRAAIREQH